MPAGLPPNLTAATAHDLVALNAAYNPVPAPTYETFPVPDVTEVWFKRTPDTTETVMAWSMTTSDAANFDPLVSIYTGTPSALTPYLAFSGANTAQPLQIPVTGGVTLYFKVENSVGSPASVDVTLNIYATYGPRTAVPTGSPLINSDADGFPAILVDTTGTNVGLQFAGLPQGESGAVLSDGTLMVQNQTSNHPEIWAVVSGALARTHNVTGVTVPGMLVSSDRATQFYVASPLGTIVYKVSNAGVVSGTTYGALAHTVRDFGVKLDGSTLYYTSGTASPVYTWVTATNLAGANFAAAMAGYDTRDIIVMSDTSVVIGYNKQDGTISKLVQYSAAGAVLHTWTTDVQAINHIVQACNDPTSVWVWFRRSGTGGIDTLEQITLATGTVTKTLSLPLVSAAGVVPSGYQYGALGSCPLLILCGHSLDSLPALPLAQPTEVGGGVTPTDPIRVQRRFLLQSDTNLQMFLSRLEIFCQAGVGLITGQGSDPQLMLRVSRDGGQTWGPERWRSMGALGDYTARPYWNRLPRGRNLVAEITVTDPTFLAFLDCIVDLEEGTS